MANEQHPDPGFTLIEVLLVVLILGLLSAVVVAATDGMKANADETACASDRYTLQVAAEAFFAQRSLQVIPAANGGPDGYEQTLVEADLLGEVSALHDVDLLGEVSPTSGSPCDD